MARLAPSGAARGSARTLRLASGVWLLPGRPHLVGLVVGTRVVRLSVNGETVSAAPNALAPALGGALTARLWLGGVRGRGGRFRGEVGDVLVFDRALEDEELTAVALELMRRYRIIGGRRPDPAERLRRALRRTRARLLDFVYRTPESDEDPRARD